MEFEETSQADGTIAQNTKRRKNVYSVFLVWELVRFGLVWNMTARALHIDADYTTAIYVLWSMAPSLAVIAGFLLLWIHQHSRPQLLFTLLVMTKGFQIVFGSAAALLLMITLGYHPLFFLGEFFIVSAVTLADLGVCLLLLRTMKRQNKQV